MSALSRATRGRISSSRGRSRATRGRTDLASSTVGANAPDELALGARALVGQLAARAELHTGPGARVEKHLGPGARVRGG
jgi:hypothetical protein